MKRWSRGTLSLVAGCLLFSAVLALAQREAPPASEAKPTRKVDFLRDVRPILSQHCFPCHGPDDETRQAKLRLDVRQQAFGERRGKRIVAPGSPADSLLVELITAEDEKERMPQPEGKPLSPAQIETLRLWIEQGAEWTEHWAFRAPARPDLPEVRDASWPRDPIDRFVLARLEAEGLAPTTEATREAWLRRASFDLTGLPPTPAEIDEFAEDSSPDAYEKQVDRLLASTRYGERQAQEWLDLARYADTNGYQVDGPRQAWKWREWVIEAFNANKPFDEFTVEQLAGDLLPEPTLAQRVATGFNRNHPTNSEAGEEEDEYRSAYVMDRVHTTATAWMGLTLACSQCHDHKYDPLSQRDFYRFYGFFNSVKERDSDGPFGRRNPRPSIPVPNPDQVPRLADLDARIRALEARLEAQDPLADAEQREWEAKMRERIGGPVEWTTIDPVGLLSRSGALLQRLEDGSILSTGPTPVRDTYEFVAQPGKRKIQALRLEVLPHESHRKGATGRADDGRFILSALEVRSSTLSESQDPPLVPIARADADLNQKRDEDPKPGDPQPGTVDSSIVAEAVGGGEVGMGMGGPGFGRGWSIVGDEKERPHEAVLLPMEPLDLNDASVLRASLHFASREKYKSLIGRFRISYTEDERIRSLLLPVVGKTWSSVGPFAAQDAGSAFETAFEPEADVAKGIDRTKTYAKPAPPVEAEGKGGPPGAKPGGKPEGKPRSPGEGKPAESAPAAEKAEAATSARAGQGQPADAPKRGKPESRKPKEEKPAPPPDAERKNEGKKEEKKEEKKEARLPWTEQTKWRDGATQRLQGQNAAYYLARKISSDRARTVVLRLDGPDGYRMWLNGEVVQAEAPPPAKEKPAEKKAAGGAAEEDEEEEESEFDEAAFAEMMGRGAKEPRKIRIGLREGENEVVLKAVYGARGGRPRRSGDGAPPTGPPRGGGSFTFEVVPEGDDLLDYEVLSAMRAEAAEPPAAVAAEAAAEVQVETDGDGAQSSNGKVAPPSPSEVRRKKIREHFRTRISTIGRTLFEELERLKAEKKKLEKEIPEAIVMEELEEPRPTHVFKRGQYKNKAERVEPGVPAVLPPMPADLPPNRLGLARWLVWKENPLTARVEVNRIWQQYFGTGIVKTAEDFGIRGELPSHPDLLDWLAVEFVESGWDLKTLHRRIALSATYRQSPAATPEKLERDPENRLLARGPRLRLTAEMIRDNALAVSGLLVEKIGGESVKPRQPKGLWKAVSGTGAYKRDRADAQYRRGLYVYWKRGVPYPSMITFDAAKRETCTVTRPHTTTPLQALVLLNDPVFVEAAKMLGQRLLKRPAKDDDDRIAFGFLLCTSRPPAAEEIAVLKKLLDESREHYKADAEAAKKLLAVGDATVDDKLDAAELGAWAAVGSALLNLDATIHRG